jgi:alkylation response protein AidB-like acyl-CoA dehydrogenase
MGKQHSLGVDADASPASAPSCDAVASALAGAAPREEAGTADIARSVALLRRAGWLLDDGAAAPELTAARLRRVGAANLPVGRLFEGHINALYLARIHGDASAAERVNSLVKQGAFLGVWGADGAVPVGLSPDGATLVGQKNFASGLGTVSHAVVTVCSGPDVRLALVGVRDATRSDPSVWTMQGMRATASGCYDFNGIPVADILWLGAPGDYLTEPHFVGGVWRIAALQIGGALGLLAEAADILRARDRLAAPAQMARLSAVVIQSLGASALVTRAAIAAAPKAVQTPDQAAAISAAARLLTEEVALDAIRTVEQCLGLGHFEEASATNRKARDLAVYLRQAARDAFQTRVGEACFAQEGRLWTLI